VFLTGRIRTAAEPESLLANRAADAVATARTWIAEPQWYVKVAANREAEIRPCMSYIQGCVGHVFRGLPGTCVLNPRAGNELDWPRPSRVSQARTVAVIGGGPAGLEAARPAAERAEIGLSLAWWERELERLRVQVKLRAEVSPDHVPDANHVIWAIGAHLAQTAIWRLRPWIRDGLPGSAHAVHAREVLADEIAARDRIAEIDEGSGWPAFTLIAHLLAAPAVETVDLFTPEAVWGSAAGAVTFESGAVAGMLERGATRLKVDSRTIAQATESNNKRYMLPGTTSSSFEMVILSFGTAARETPDGALE
jgi:hypothetical protein